MSHYLRMSSPISISTRVLLSAGVVGAVLFMVVFLVEGAIRSGYSPSRQPVSALALGERGWVQIASFVITGTLMGGFALGVRRSLDDGSAAVWGSVLLVVFAVGLVASGAFVMDPPAGYPPGNTGATVASWHGIAHDAAGLIVFTALPAAALVLTRPLVTASELAWLGVASAAAGVMTAGLFVVHVLVSETGGPSQGLVQRAAIGVGWGWIALVAVTLVAVTEEPAR